MQALVGIFGIFTRKKDKDMRVYKADETLGNEGILVKRELANRTVDTHIHEFLEIIFIRSGEGIESVGGVDYHVKRGDMLFVNFGREHAFSGQGMEFIHILLRPEFMSELLINSENIFDIFSLPQFASIEGDITPSEIVSFVGSDLVSVTNLVDGMLMEYETKRAGWRTALYGYAEVLFTLLIRRLKESGHSIDEVREKIESYVEEHLFGKISLSDIASDCFYNPSYFSRKFKSCFGKNLSDYVKERRILRAAELLSGTDRSVSDIAESCGFSDKTQFYKLFRAEFGKTPAEYRKK